MSYSKTGIRQYLDKSVIHIQKGKVRKAIKELNRGLEIEPWNIDIAYQIAALYQRMNERINAISVFQNNLILLENRKDEMNLKDYNKAKILVYKAILSLDPVDIAVRVKIGKYYLAQENKQKAAYLELFTAFNQCLVVRDDALTAHVKGLLGKVNLSVYERDLLSAQFFHSIRDEEKYQELFFEMLEKYSGKIKYLKGIFEKHLSFYPYDEKILRRYCMLLVQIKEYRTANSMIRKALGVKPDNLFFLELLSITSVRLNLLDEALELFYKLEGIYIKNKSEKKLELARKNIDILKRQIEVRNFPEDMPPTPDEMDEGDTNDKETEIALENDGKALDDLKTIVEKSLTFEPLNDDDYEKETLVDKKPDVPDDLKNLIYNNSENPTELMTHVKMEQIENINQEIDKKMSSKINDMSIKFDDEDEGDSKVNFDTIRQEILDFTSSQERNFEMQDGKKEISLFFKTITKEISSDFRALTDMGIACFMMGYKEMAMGFFKMALKIAPGKRQYIESLIEVCRPKEKVDKKKAAA